MKRNVYEHRRKVGNVEMTPWAEFVYEDDLLLLTALMDAAGFDKFDALEKQPEEVRSIFLYVIKMVRAHEGSGSNSVIRQLLDRVSEELKAIASSYKMVCEDPKHLTDI